MLGIFNIVGIVDLVIDVFIDVVLLVQDWEQMYVVG